MSICDYTDLGNFPTCEPIDLELIGDTEIMNPNTRFQCTFSSGEVGLLDPGVYLAENSGVTYLFKVV